MLGPDCALFRRAAGGYRCLQRDAAAVIQKSLFCPDSGDPDRLFELSRHIARALGTGDLALAQIYGLRIPTAGLDRGQLARLAAASAFIKANFDPDQPRDAQGRWSDDDEGGSTPLPPPAAAPVPLSAAPPVASTAAIGATAAIAANAAPSIFGPLGRTALAGLAELAGGFTGPTVFLGVLFLPTNGSLVTESPLPDRPDLGYRHDRDTGVLEIYRQDSGWRQILATGHIGPDDLFRDSDGRIIGRNLGNSVAVDPGVLPSARGIATTVAATSEPRLCPDPTPENTNGRSERTMACQEQITGLPRGLDVTFRGIRFDGCRESDGTMLEAKGEGVAHHLLSPTEWKRYFIGNKSTEKQMREQSRWAWDRQVEWHFAEPEMAEYHRNLATREGLNNVTVLQTPLKVKQ